MIFYFNHFSLIIFYHSVWLRVPVCCQLVQFMLVHKGYDNHHCHNKPPDRKWSWSVDNVMPKRDGLRTWKILKKIQLSSDHGVEKLVSDPALEKLKLDHAGRQLSFCHWGRDGVLCHRAEFSTVAAAVKFCWSRPAKMNWDLKHHEMCRMLGVMLA